MTCRCDILLFPAPRDIAAGLPSLPRQLAGFSEFRSALLAEVRRYPALAAFRAHDGLDLGLMLLEMWAVLCDAVSFYDQVHANESYLRTAVRGESVRALVELLGYVPRPAVAASVELAVFVDGNTRVTLPAGTAFRSEAFDDEPPQVFELLEPIAVHPWNNRWKLSAPRASTVAAGPGTAPTALLLGVRGAALQENDVALVVPSPNSAWTRARRVRSVERIQAEDAQSYVRATFSSALALPASAALESIRLLRATRRTGLWLLPYEAGSANPIDTSLTQLVLDGLHREFRSGQDIIVERLGELRWFSLVAVSEVQQRVLTGTDADGHSLFGWIPATRLTLDTALNTPSRRETGNLWSTSDASTITVHSGLVAAGTPATPDSTTVAADAPLVLAAPVLGAPDVDPPRRFALADAHDVSVVTTGELDVPTRTLLRDGDEPDWEAPLAMPVEVWGNVISAARGETVAREVLGSGDRSQKNQRFALKKSPLSYVAAPTATGVASTLTVWVDGVRWNEVASFFAKGPEDQVYVVRLDADGVASVLFGDGVNGARLTTGAGNVVAAYRYGAGAAAPPARSIHQVAKAVKDLTRVAQPVAASGGADAEEPENVRRYAPRSALVLGRAVSILDLQALAAAVPGVRAVETTWGWEGEQQRAVVQCWYAGSPSDGAVAARLRSMTDPTTPIAAQPAKALPALLILQVELDPAHIASDVTSAIFAVLAAKGRGMLRPEQLGIAQALYRSRLSAAILEVQGAVAVHMSAMLWRDTAGALRYWAQDGYGARPGTGAYFDFEAGGIWLNGEILHLG